MPCGVISCSINDDRFLWKCEFCNKKYHAACVGVQRQREHFISAFMVPMCADCQPTLRKEVDVRKLLYQQEQLVDAIHSQTDTNHRIAADLKKFCLVSELFDSIEHLLNDVKETLANVNKNNSNMCSAVGKHMKAYDSQLNMTMTHINESNSTTSANIIKHLDERLNCLRNDLATPMKEAEQEIPQGTDSSILHILEEVKLVSEAISNFQMKSQEVIIPHQTLEKELAEVSQKSALPKNDHTSPGWRFLGNKWHWKLDWTQFDAKQRSRRLQEKAAEKSRRKKRNQKRQNYADDKQNYYNNNKSNNNNTNSNYNTNNKSNNNIKHNVTHINNRNNNNSNRNKNHRNSSNHPQLPLDKNLLAMAKTQFSGPPLSIEHPIAGLSTTTSKARFISFKKGETINADHSDVMRHKDHESKELDNSLPQINDGSQFELDPLRPPIVRLTEQSVEGDGRFLKARLRDPKIMKVVRMYLAFLKDQPATVCIEGMTSTSIKMMLASEGLPTAPDHLQRIFTEVHQEFGVGAADAVADLQSYQRFLTSERTHRLQQLRESTNKFHTLPSNFRK